MRRCVCVGRSMCVFVLGVEAIKLLKKQLLNTKEDNIAKANIYLSIVKIN